MFVRQFGLQGLQHAQAADAAVKNADGGFGHESGEGGDMRVTAASHSG
jgi:hypothetical protein